MSTPVFDEPTTTKSSSVATTADSDLTTRMQHMIDLQNEEQHLSQHEHIKEIDQFYSSGSSRGEPPETTTMPIASAQPKSSMGAKSLSRSVGLSSLHNLHQDNNHNNNIESITPEVFGDGVGRGTLLFNTETLGSTTTAEDQSLLATMMPQTQNNATYGTALPENPHYHPPVPNHHDQYEFTDNMHYQKQQQEQQSSFCNLIGYFCSCVWTLLYMCLCCCSTDAIEEQALHRSFCYGAIDGMLTGSGIVAAFSGMSVLAPTSTLSIRLFVMAFSAAACFADSLCMALGHVWTTHVLVSASARERTQQRVTIEKNRPDAKGKLVDMLLERGMLKIDAMSFADTLEGYPDMFVSVLVGDALIPAAAAGTDSNGMDRNNRSWSGGSAAGTPRSWSGHYDENARSQDALSSSVNQNNGSFLSWKFPSYGQRINELDEEIDPEAAFVGSAMTESRREGLFMMMGFSLFAVVPSLIYLIVPMVIAPPSSSSSSSSATHDNGGATSATSVVVTTAAAVMWCLGVWKSRFLDSNWVLFGIETVVVLLVCIGAAYGLGALLSVCFPGLAVTISSTSELDSSTSEL
ncbi:expressed unknown protein [Seminavis robusta]|uniref:Transmembrane protein n=1 Tax=Seminavis robusta TaxID=568900 RepID=A0A9N8E4D4_9STRA|nr:expressed unknown protein [Seminavis robusta]|eukprot:Sro530_g161260.1 n/a (576) ;mRNA; r:41354-43081